MNAREARDILSTYRPGTADAADPEIAAALKLADENADLARWLSWHVAVQNAFRARLRSIEPPAGLKAAILARKVVRPAAWWREPVWLAAAATILLLLGLALVQLGRPRADQLAGFRERMIGAAEREYRMDIVTGDMGRLREYLAQRGAPADFNVPGSLAKLRLTGGGLLRWQNQPVSMICFNRGDDRMLFLFVMSKAALRRPPPDRPQTAVLHDMTTVTWAAGGNVYVLAGPEASQ